MNDNGPVLRDIHLPPAGWWPPAAGWWLLVLVVIVLAGGAAWWWRRRARQRPLRSILREIDAIEAAHADHRDDTRVAEEASRLLRRVARRLDPAVASQTGPAWRAFVQRHAHDAATWHALDGLMDVRFRAHPAFDIPAVASALRAWCRAALRVPHARRFRKPAVVRSAATP